VVTSYRDARLPAPPWGAQDAAALAEGSYFTGLHQVPAGELTRARLARALGDLRSLPAGETAVVYLSCRALTDGAGRVQLLPADADPDDPATWLPLRGALEQLRECPARKLLILDTWPLPDP